MFLEKYELIIHEIHMSTLHSSCMREICVTQEAGNSSKSHWDDQLPTELHEKCLKFFLELPKLGNIEFK